MHLMKFPQIERKDNMLVHIHSILTIITALSLYATKK